MSVPGSSVADEVYRRHARRLIGLAAALVGASDADDVVAAAITRFVSSAAWPTVANAEAYLTRAVVNEARSWARSAMRRTEREARWVRGRGVVDEGSGDPELAGVLLRLPVRQRAVVFLTYRADLAPDVIAARATLRKELS